MGSLRACDGERRQREALRTFLAVRPLPIMASDHFYLFTAWASFSEAAQESLRQVRSADDIISIASEKGYQITVQQLRHFAHRLTESHWMWNGLNPQGIQEFFGESAERTEAA